MIRSRRTLINKLALTLLPIGLFCGVGPALSAGGQDYEYRPIPKLSIESARRYFVRIGYTYAKPNDKFSDARDVSGPLVSYFEYFNYSGAALAELDATYSRFTGGSALSSAQDALATGTFSLDSYIDSAATARGVLPESISLGTPSGVNQKAMGAGTPTVSLGMFLDENKNWAAEAYVLALPVLTKIKGAGRIGSPTPTTEASSSNAAVIDAQRRKNQAVQVDLGEVASTRVMPPLVMLHRYFGDKNNRFRPSLGVGVSYFIFFDSKASSSLDAYTGGKTDIKIKNGFGYGGFLGGHLNLVKDWSVHATVGYMKLKTKATLTTAISDFVAFADSPAVVQSALDAGTAVRDGVIYVRQYNNGIPGSTPGTIVPGPGLLVNGGATPSLGGALAPTLRAISRAKATAAGVDANSPWVSVREISGKLDPWIFNVAVGYDF